MAHSLVFAPEAEADILEAYDWYESQRRGLGEEFLNCVEASLHALERHPERHAVAFAQYRRTLVRRFPYAIFFEATAETVTIYGVLHTARDPDKWRRRLG